ncbi:MAG TPA: hypothetical protein VGI21_21880 [Streptosporangiaceae bacterium]
MTFPLLTLDAQLLAAPGPVQVAWLIARNLPIDELAEQFSDSVQLFLPDLIEDGQVNDRAAAALRAVDAELDVLRKSGDHLLWTASAELHDSPAWQRVRDLALSALDALGVPADGYDVLAGLTTKSMIEAIRDPVQWLARPAADQQRSLDKNLTPVQDVPLTLDDCVTVLVPRLISAGALSPAAEAAVIALRDFIRVAASRGDPDLGDQTTLAASGTWATIRDLARAAADVLPDTE